ncbi:hypothetical protein JTB14_022802 [Gonioctena quinquepunctata]|nr:hypothetical protein JTB14_022802 [Gonioctena quinquepunctata]
MDIEGHKEEPPDKEESEDDEISQKQKEEWPSPEGRDQSQESKYEQGQIDPRFSRENEHEKELEEQRGKIPLLIQNVLKQETKSELGQTGQGPRPSYGKVYIHKNPEGTSPLTDYAQNQEGKSELGQIDQELRHDKDDGKSHGNMPKKLVTDEKPQKPETGIPESPHTPDVFTDCNSTLGTPLESPMKNNPLLPVFYVGDGKPKSTPLPFDIKDFSYVGNTENADLIIHSNIEIRETENVIVEFDDRMKQPLGPSEVDKAAEEGDTVISQLSRITKERSTRKPSERYTQCSRK